MGACCSGKGNTKIDKYINKINKNTQENIIFNKNIIQNNSIENFIAIENLNKDAGIPTFRLDLESTAISKNINCIMKKFLTSYENLKIRKLTIEELWNIVKFYKHDHTKSTHLLCDFRDHSQKIENFLKLFRTVNYTSEHFQSLDDAVFLRFNKYISDKNLIVIPQEENILSIENFIKFISDLKIKTKILLLDYNFQNKAKLDSYINKILRIMDFHNFFKLPNVFLPLRFFPHINNKAIIFIDIIESENFQNKEKEKEEKNFNKDLNCNINENHKNSNNLFNLCSNKYSYNNFHEDKILQFFKTFEIGLVLQLNQISNKINQDSIGKRNILVNEKKLKNLEKSTNKIDEKKSKVNKKQSVNKFNNNDKDEKKSLKDASIENEENSKYDYLFKYFEINGLNNLKDLIAKKERILEFLDYLKFEISLNRSFILQIPSDFDSKILIAIKYLIIWKIANLKPILLKNYIRQNFYCYFENSEGTTDKNFNKKESNYLDNLTDEVFDEISNFLNENFDIPKIIDSDIEFNYNDFFFQEDGNNSLSKNKKNKLSYDNHLSFEKRRLKSFPNINTINNNYFTLPLQKNPLNDEIINDNTKIDINNDDFIKKVKFILNYIFAKCNNL